MDNKDYYKILGVDKKATDQEIRKAFLKLSKKYHPDMQTGKTDEEKKESEEKFKEINEANEILSNKEKREYYDNFGCAPGQNQGNGFGTGGIDPREFFRKAGGFRGFGGFNSFGDHFGFNMGDFENHSDYNPNAPKDGRNVRIKMNISFEESIYGATKEFTVDVEDPCEHCHGSGAENMEFDTCPHCKGTGMIVQQQGMMIMQQTCHHCHGNGKTAKKHCSHCNGTGRIKSKREIKIDIPQGIWTDGRLEVNDCGEKGVNGGRNGSLIVVINVLENDLFERDETSIATTSYISTVTASLGGDIDIQTPWGLANLKIPSGVTYGKVFRIHGQGVHSSRGNGDLFVKVIIEPMTNLTDEQKKILDELNKTLTDDNLVKTTEYKKKCKDFYKSFKNMIKKS